MPEAEALRYKDWAIPSALWLLAFTALVAPAIMNGFPLVFSDTNVYVAPLSEQWSGTPPFYSMFVRLVSRVSLLGVPAVQALCVLATLELGFRALAPGAHPPARALGGLLVVVLTQLPWLTSWLMPDVFGGLGALAILALLLGPVRPASERLFLGLIVLAAALFSTANTLIYVGLGAIGWVIRSYWLRERSDRPLLVGATAALGVALALPMAWNVTWFNAWRLNVGGTAMTFSKFADAGLAQRLLAETCPDHPIPICQHLGELKAIPESQSFLWEGDPPLAGLLSAWEDENGTFGILVRRIVRRFPLEVAALVAGDIVTLAGRVTLEKELEPSKADDGVGGALQSYYPRLAPLFDAARQQRGSLLQLYHATYYKLGALLGYVGLLIVALASFRRHDRALAALALLTFIAVAAGIAVQGGLVGPYARYHVKFVWLPWIPIIVWTLRFSSPLQRRALPMG